MHGYQLIQEIGERSGGQWRPSPGAIYPALNLLEDEGLVAITAESGRKLARLTDAGTAYVTENAEQLGSPFEDAASRPTSPGRNLRGALEALAGGCPPGRPLGHRRAGHPGARGPRALAPGPLPDPGRRPGADAPGRPGRGRLTPISADERHPATASGCRRRLVAVSRRGRRRRSCAYRRTSATANDVGDGDDHGQPRQRRAAPRAAARARRTRAAPRSRTQDHAPTGRAQEHRGPDEVGGDAAAEHRRTEEPERLRRTRSPPSPPPRRGRPRRRRR